MTRYRIYGATPARPVQITWSGGGMTAAVVQAGTWFVGDPAYAVPMGLWIPLLESTGFFRVQPVGTIGGHQVLAFRTFYQTDDLFRDQEGHLYHVISGFLGVTPVALSDKGQERLAQLGRVVQWPAAVSCTSDGFGNLQFGQYRIGTR